jgi:hypothetical protein
MASLQEEVNSDDLSSGWSVEAWRGSWAFVVENRLPAFVVAVLVPAIVAWIQFSWRSLEMKTAIITAVWTLVVYFAICLSVYLVFLLYRVPTRRLVGAGMTIRQARDKIASLEEQRKPRMEVSCGRSVDKSIVKEIDGNLTWFRARLDLIGDVPIPDIEANVIELLEDGTKVPLRECLMLTMCPGKLWPEDSNLRTLYSGKPEFVDLVKSSSDGKAVFPVKMYHRSVSYETLMKPNHAYEIVVALTSRSHSTVTCCFDFSWTGNPDTSDIRLLSVTPPLPIPNTATSQRSPTL